MAKPSKIKLTVGIFFLIHSVSILMNASLACVKWRVFSKKELILGHIVLVPLKESPLFRNELNYTQVNVGAKVEPPTA